MSDLRSASRRLSQVWNLPDLFSEPGRQGSDSGSEESELVAYRSGRRNDRFVAGPFTRDHAIADAQDVSLSLGDKNRHDD
jgi:hypothetical protein